jgi:hypothetical protein
MPWIIGTTGHPAARKVGGNPSTLPPSCVSCIWFRWYWECCHEPRLWTERDIVTGEALANGIPRYHRVRDDSTACGFDGKWYVRARTWRLILRYFGLPG